MHSRSFLSILSIFGLIILLITSSCGKETTAPEAVESEIDFQLSGALNRSFDSENANFCGDGQINASGDINKLLIRLKVNSTFDGTEELIQIYLMLPLDSTNEVPEPGNYTLDESKLGPNTRFLYQMVQGEDSFARYMFSGFYLRLEIQESMNDQIKGRFSLKGRQQSGLRMINGQLEEVELANDGQVNVSGKFNVDLIVRD